MRIYYKSMTLPKKAAKRVQDFMSYTVGDEIVKTMKLSEAQNLTATLLGYTNWHELELITKVNDRASLLDEECDYNSQLARIDYQCVMWGRISPITKSVLRHRVLVLRVSSGNPDDSRLIGQPRTANMIMRGDGQYESEWRFFSSHRSSLCSEQLSDWAENFSTGAYSLDEYLSILVGKVTDQPENTDALSALLYTIASHGLSTNANFAFMYDSFDSTLKSAFPDDFPKEEDVNLDWGSIENRNFIRSLYWLAINYYTIGAFNKAISLVNLVLQISDEMFNDHDVKGIAMINDLRRKKPLGNVSFA